MGIVVCVCSVFLVFACCMFSSLFMLCVLCLRVSGVLICFMFGMLFVVCIGLVDCVLFYVFLFGVCVLPGFSGGVMVVCVFLFWFLHVWLPFPPLV